MKERVLPTLITLLLVVIPCKANAANLFGEFQRLPDDIERGFSIGADFGIVYTKMGPSLLTGKSPLKNPGFQLVFTTGYDIMKYLSVEGVYTLGINEIMPPTAGGGLTSFQAHIAAKGAFPLGRFYPFCEFGPGFAYVDPDALFNGQNKKMSFLFAGGFEYYTLLRHYSLYAKASYYYIKLPIDSLSISVGLKYTF